MLLSVLLLLLLLFISSLHASHFRGTMMTYWPKETHADGSVTVIVHCKQGYATCRYSDSWTCSGNCVSASSSFSWIKAEEFSSQWCQNEATKTLLLPDNSPFQLVLSGGSWLSNVENVGGWKAVTDVELRTRSDNGKPNTSPQSTILPVLRIPSTCKRIIDLLAFDPDGDDVKCRFANSSLSECAVCTTPSVLSLSPSCSLSFDGTNGITAGSHVVQLVMEDFPRQTITLTQTNGSQVVKTTRDSISKIPLQFVFTVDPGVGSCMEDLYLPKFLHPTPENRARLYNDVNQTLEIPIRVEAHQSVTTELLFSGPHDVVKNSTSPQDFSLKWTPSDNEGGGNYPICFVVQASVSGSVYQSEPRCVVVTVGPKPLPSFVKVVKLRITSTLSLEANSGAVSDLIKGQLNRRGLNITNVQILHSEAVNVP